MDKPKQSEILKALKSDLKDAEQLRKELDQDIEVWKKEYNGELYGNEKKGRSQIISRDIKKHSEWQHASIIDPFVSNPDIIKCSPVTFEDKTAAKQNELVLNTQFCRQFNRYNFMTKAVKVLDQEGTCVIRTGWEYEEEEVEVDVPVIDIDIMTGQPMIVGMTTTTEIQVVKNRPTAKVCRNEDTWIDPTCQDDIDNLQFIITRYESDLSTLKEDKRYKNLDKIKLDASDDHDYESPDDTEFKFKDDPRKKILVYEYWGNYDVDGDGIAEPIVCVWVNDTIIRLEENPYPDKKPPFLVVPFNSVPFQLHGEPNAELLSDVQKIKTAIYRGFIDNMAQSNNAQKGIKKGALDSTNRKRFFGGENFEFNGSPADFWDGSYNQIPSSAFNILQLMNNEAESITGIKAFSQGMAADSLGVTATGVRGVLDSASTRRLNIVRNIAENLIKPLMRKWMAYNAEFLQDQEIMRITNEEFIEIKRDDLAGYVDIDISVSTNEDNANKAQELAFMLQTIGPNEDPTIRKTIMAEIAKLHRMPDLAKKLEEYQPQPDPLQQQAAMLQVELLKAQVMNEYAKGQENQVDVQLKQAKAQNEMAKAGKVSSEKDMMDLDFLQKGQGVDQKSQQDVMKFQMEMEKQNRQLGMADQKNQMDLNKQASKHAIDTDRQMRKAMIDTERDAQKLELDKQRAEMRPKSRGK